MSEVTRTSNCSLGVAVDFYWHDCIVADGHIEAAVRALVSAVSGGSRRWNPWTLPMVKAEFRDRLLRAAAGELKPISEVKEIGDGRVLFEIRWPDVTVTDEVAPGVFEYSAVEVRLLHAEPVELSVCAVGLHAHEKRVYPEDAKRTHDEQDAEIALALGRYNGGVGHLWGFTLP